MTNNHTIKKHPRAEDTYIYYTVGSGVGMDGKELVRLYYEIQQILIENNLIKEQTK